MYQKLDCIDIFNNSAVIYLRKSSSKIVSWISILLIGSLLFSWILLFYNYETYNVYYAKVVKNDEENYISMSVDETFIELQNRNFLEINSEEYKCHLMSMSDNYYLLNEHKYWQTTFECELPEQLNINENVIEVKVDKGKTTLFKQIINKIRKGMKNGRIKN